MIPFWAAEMVTSLPTARPLSLVDAGRPPLLAHAAAARWRLDSLDATTRTASDRLRARRPRAERADRLVGPPV